MHAGPSRNIVDPNGIQGLSGIKITDRLEDISKMKRAGKRISSPERWELAQLKHAGVLKVTEYPDFDEEGAVSSPYYINMKTLYNLGCSGKCTFLSQLPRNLVRCIAKMMPGISFQISAGKKPAGDPSQILLGNAA